MINMSREREVAWAVWSDSQAVLVMHGQYAAPSLMITHAVNFLTTANTSHRYYDRQFFAV
jgi:hypothetical protein